LRDPRALTGRPVGDSGIPDVTWIGPGAAALAEADWQDPSLRTLGMVLFDPESGDRLCLWLNGGGGTVDVVTPPARPGRSWRKAVESLDFGSLDASFPMPPRSAILLVEAVASDPAIPA
jgi:pullulanase/glycogen debranching enzyme